MEFNHGNDRTIRTVLLPRHVAACRAGAQHAGTQGLALAGYRHATDPAEGLAKDAKFDMDGFKNVLKLRAELEGQWGGKPPAPDKYVDLSYYDRALKGL